MLLGWLFLGCCLLTGCCFKFHSNQWFLQLLLKMMADEQLLLVALSAYYFPWQGFCRTFAAMFHHKYFSGLDSLMWRCQVLFCCCAILFVLVQSSIPVWSRCVSCFLLISAWHLGGVLDSKSLEAKAAETLSAAVHVLMFTTVIVYCYCLWSERICISNCCTEQQGTIFFLSRTSEQLPERVL